MTFWPLVESMNQVASCPVGPKYTVILFDKIKSAGEVKYSYLLTVYDNETKQPVYMVASEVNEMMDTLGGGTHFLGVFDGSGHANLGSSDDWGNPRKFFEEAIRLAENRFSAST